MTKLLYILLIAEMMKVVQGWIQIMVLNDLNYRNDNKKNDADVDDGK